MFRRAQLNAAGVQEIQTAVAKIFQGLTDYGAQCQPSIRCFKEKNKDEAGYAYRFTIGQEGAFVLYHPADYHISLVRNIGFVQGATTDDIQDDLDRAMRQQPFSIAQFANGALIVPKKSGKLVYFTYDFETSPASQQRTDQKAQLQDLANAVDYNLADYTTTSDVVSSFHVSFGMALAGDASATVVQNMVIAALKKYGGYSPLHSSAMQVSTVALLESPHTNNATRYTTYISSPLSDGALSVTSSARTVYSMPNLLLDSGQTFALAAPDRALIGEVNEADVATYVPWVEDDEALAVVSAGPTATDKGWLTVQGGALFGVGVATEEDTGHLVIAMKPGEVGAVTVSGGSSTVAVGGDVNVGEYGAGTLQATGGATIASYGAYLGYQPKASGAVSLQGPGTTWQVLNDFIVGYQGAGALQLSQGARILGNPDSDSYLYVGSEAGSHGAVQLTDPGTQIQLYDGAMIVGSAGSGAVYIRNQAAVYSSSGSIADQQGSQGAVLIDGAGSLWQLSDNLWIGAEGAGSLGIQNGGSAACQYLTIGAFDGATGILTVAGPQSVCNVQKDAFIGGWMANDNDLLDRNDWRDGGVAQVTVQNGGLFSVGGTVWVGRQGTVQLIGGTLEAENLDIMPGGRVISAGGTLAVRSQISVDGLLQLDQPLVLGSGMSLVGGGLVSAPQTQFLAGSSLAPGHSVGTLTFNGNLRLAAGSRLEIELAGGGQSDRIVVSNTLHLGGTLVLSGLAGSGPLWGYEFASAGTIEGAFDAVDTSALPTTPKQVVVSDHWSLVKFKDLSDVAGTQNAQQTAAVLDRAIDAGQSGWLTDRLVTIGNDAVMSSTLDQMQGELYPTLSAIGVQNTANLYRVLSDRLRPVVSNAQGGQTSRDTMGQTFSVCRRKFGRQECPPSCVL